MTIITFKKYDKKDTFIHHASALIVDTDLYVSKVVYLKDYGWIDEGDYCHGTGDIIIPESIKEIAVL